MNIVSRNVSNNLAKLLSVKNTIRGAAWIKFNLSMENPHILGHTKVAQCKYFFASMRSFEALQDQIEQTPEAQPSNLEAYIKNSKTIALLQKKGINSLFPIQIETFQAAYQGRDILASDRTGSGKTIAYSLPIIQKLRDQGKFKSGKKQVKFLVMCPTRQLALQVYKEIATLKHNSSDYHVVAVYGGSPIEDQIRQLKGGVDIVVATPGRLMDLIERRCLSFAELEATCIDQADQMLEKGFKLDIEEIFRLIESHRNQKTQNLMFSATIPQWVDKIARDFMDQSKKKINLISKNQSQTSITVEHLAVDCTQTDRINCIKSLIKTYNKEEFSTIIFAETKLQVTDLAMSFGKDAAFLQGDMSQKEREYNLNSFRNGKRKVLIATDVASRGLDIDNVGLVIQLQPPRNTEPFIHRAGRTGRAGKKGICITLFDRRKNLQSMLRVESEANITFNHIPKPHFEESDEIWQKKLNRIPHELKQTDAKNLNNERIQRMAQLLLSSHIDVKQLIKRQIIAIAGEAPVSHSLSSDQAGYKTFVVAMKSAETKINSLTALNFLKTHFNDLKITNVHIQSNNIIFDIPSDNLDGIKQVLESADINDSEYQISEATFKDREMLPLKQLGRGKYRKEGGSVFENKNRERSDFRSSGPRDGGRREERQAPSNNFSSDKIELFVPSLPFQTEQSDLEDQLRDMKIDFESVRVRKKGDTHAFAFVTLTDPVSLRFLLKNGMNINGKKARVFNNQNRQQRTQRTQRSQRSQRPQTRY